jgi:hypothetical protein
MWKFTEQVQNGSRVGSFLAINWTVNRTFVVHNNLEMFGYGNERKCKIIFTSIIDGLTSRSGCMQYFKCIHRMLNWRWQFSGQIENGSHVVTRLEM